MFGVRTVAHGWKAKGGEALKRKERLCHGDRGAGAKMRGARFLEGSFCRLHNDLPPVTGPKTMLFCLLPTALRTKVNKYYVVSLGAKSSFINLLTKMPQGRVKTFESR